ncbi:MAG TPA: hypothetical protein C5S37_02250 [Methanophagales archaeon]|nr:hypothetical protein [Methanophagales archaeon]
MLLPEKAKGDVTPRKEFKGKRIGKGIWKKKEVEFVSGEILIKLKPGKKRDSAFQEKLFSGDLKKAKLKRKYDRFGVGLIDAGDKINVLKECERLEKDPEVEYAARQFRTTRDIPINGLFPGLMRRTHGI